MTNIEHALSIIALNNAKHELTLHIFENHCASFDDHENVEHILIDDDMKSHEIAFTISKLTRDQFETFVQETELTIETLKNEHIKKMNLIEFEKSIKHLIDMIDD